MGKPLTARLQITSTVHPELYAALTDLPVGQRGERLRLLATLGILLSAQPSAPTSPFNTAIETSNDLQHEKTRTALLDQVASDL